MGPARCEEGLRLAGRIESLARGLSAPGSPWWKSFRTRTPSSTPPRHPPCSLIPPTHLRCWEPRRGGCRRSGTKALSPRTA